MREGGRGIERKREREAERERERGREIERRGNLDGRVQHVVVCVCLKDGGREGGKGERERE